MVSELIGKYIFLVQTFVEAGDGGLSLEEVQTLWERRYGCPYARRSFVNHREAIAEIFGIEIICSRSTNRYYISDAADAVDRRQAVDYLLNTFTVNSLLSLSEQRLRGRVAVEDVPSGQKWLVSLMQALLDNEILEIDYLKYMSGEAEHRRIHPYALKEFAKRWYLVAFSVEAGAMRVYGLDRIKAVRRSGEHFRMEPGFRVDELFESSYGVYLPEGEQPSLVRIRTSLRNAAYLEDLPLHPTQRLVGTDAGHAEFVMRLIPNPNFIMELCKMGDRVEVLAPESLRQTVKNELVKALQQYEP
ncbi:MAG: WYL domain-containing protein [Bacteroidales bacterium]|nr:WYL domain-containing protein [Bacteroidales bacterium]MBP5374685.1 WYL domain-containing protein [Bacteroidales bacterium]